MKVVTNTSERLVLRAGRLPAALVNIPLGPAVIWLGFMIVQEGDDAWFGWCIAALGLVMLLGGVWALFARRTLELDRCGGLIRTSFTGPLVHWDQQMPLDALETVSVDWTKVGRRAGGVIGVIFSPRADSYTATLRLREFWTRGGAEATVATVHRWLREAGHPAGTA